jgi:hypothetical protein
MFEQILKQFYKPITEKQVEKLMAKIPVVKVQKVKYK